MVRIAEHVHTEAKEGSMTIKTRGSFNFYSHLTGVIAAVFGTVFWAIVASYSASVLITALIYGASVIFLFLAGSFYHAFRKEESEDSFWREMDRLAISFMIAVTYTPIRFFIPVRCVAPVHDSNPMGSCWDSV